MNLQPPPPLPAPTVSSFASHRPTSVLFNATGLPDLLAPQPQPPVLPQPPCSSGVMSSLELSLPNYGLSLLPPAPPTPVTCPTNSPLVFLSAPPALSLSSLAPPTLSAPLVAAPPSGHSITPTMSNGLQSSLRQKVSFRASFEPRDLQMATEEGEMPICRSFPLLFALTFFYLPSVL